MTDVTEALSSFLMDFAGDRFFEAHEDLEALWWERGSDPCLQGLILFAAAFLKVQRGSAAGACKHFAAAIRHLDPSLAPACGACPQLDTARVRTHAQACLAALAPYVGPRSAPLPPGALGTVVPRYAFAPGRRADLPPRDAAQPGPAGPATLRATVSAALSARRAAGEPVGPSSWAPLVKEVILRTGGAFAREVVRAEVRRALGSPRPDTPAGRS